MSQRTAPHAAPLSATWCRARIQLVPHDRVLAPCMLPAGHTGPHDPRTNAVESYGQPKKVRK